MNSSATAANVVARLRSSTRRSRSSSAFGSIPLRSSSRHSLALSRAFWRLRAGYSPRASPGRVFASRVSGDQNKGLEARFAYTHTEARNISVHHVVPKALTAERFDFPVGQAVSYIDPSGQRVGNKTHALERCRLIRKDTIPLLEIKHLEGSLLGMKRSEIESFRFGTSC